MPLPIERPLSRTLCRLGALLVFAGHLLASPTTYAILATDQAAWPDVLAPVGFRPASPDHAGIFIVRSGTPGSPDWPARVEAGAVLVLEGDSSTADQFGFRKTAEAVRTASVIDVHRPQLSIVWESPRDVPRFQVPPAARVFARERWSAAPLLAGMRRGTGAVLWIATAPGDRGYERYPYILQALADLGVEPPFRASRLWAFFDSSYRSRVDLDYFASRWRTAGIAALHVAAWHFYEASPSGDAYLRSLIAACHRQGILVYAWLELPHVSEKFWDDHPQWREQTALLQDAHLDWRKLMNLRNRDCFRAVAEGTRELIGRFDWDGVNLAELYFESLEGASNPGRFTPMNPDVRAEFQQRQGFDPQELFRPGAAPAPARLRTFLDYRVELARRMQTEWVDALETIRRQHPDLDLVLTHIDDRFDTGMRDALGADTAGALPLLDRHSLTFLVEDPATVWNLGSRRYQEIASRYPKSEKLAIDINVVERYQEVYPTRQPTGTELYQLLHQASASFPRVALYFENSIQAPDWPWLSAAASTVTRSEQVGVRRVVESRRGVGVPWSGPADVDGSPWPIRDESTVWLPPGTHVIEPGTREPGLRVLSFNGDLQSAQSPDGRRVELAYRSSARVLARWNRPPQRLEIDGVPAPARLQDGGILVLPRGRHLVSAE